jgi:hypothetical protein
MSIAQIKKAAVQLSAKERRSLRRFLANLDRINSPVFLRNVSRRNREMAAGKSVSRAAVIMRNKKLVSEGR